MTSKISHNQVIILSVDVEDWFQVENFKQYIPFSSWSNYELRVEKNVHRLLDLFDSIKLDRSSKVKAQSLKSSKNNNSSLSAVNHELSAKSYELDCSSNPKATFFVLGWLAERLPNLVRVIHSRGHEVASHGYRHDLCYNCGTGYLKDDLEKSKKLLEDIIGARVYGYRAPSFSINNEVLRLIQEYGYLYDSSYNSFGYNARYGKIDLNGNPIKNIAVKISGNFYELPLSNLKFSILYPLSSILNPVLPWSGGGYFRLIPFPLFFKGVRSILNKCNAYLFYIHPWEIDPGQPRVQDAKAFLKFRHYVNLKGTHSKLRKFIKAFREYNFITCSQYLKELSRTK